MQTFEMVVRSSDGLLQSLQLSAADALAARNQALASGWQVLSCEAGASRVGRSARKRAARIDVIAFAHELASLLAAGLSILQSLRTLREGARAAADALTLDRVATAVSEGLPLSAAMQAQDEVFPPLLVATVRASEQTGNLSEALLRYAEHQQRLRSLRDKLRGAAVYPALLLGLGTLVVLFLLGVVVPKFATLVESTRQELPWTSRIMLGWGRAVSEHPGATVAVLAVLVLALLGAVRHLRASGARARWVERLPIVGALIREFRHAQLFRTTGMLVKGGIPLAQAIALGETLVGHDDQARLRRVGVGLRQGLAFSDALREAGLTDPVTNGMVAVAEQTGSLAEILDRIGQFKESRLERSVDWASRLIEPVLMIGIGLVIGTIIVMMYLPIFDLASSLE